MSEVGSKSMQNKVKHFPEMCLVIGLFKVLLQLKNRCRGLHVATALFCHAYERVRTVFFFFMPYKAVNYAYARINGIIIVLIKINTN